MAILVIQLARFGDIFQTCPVLNALKRQNPATEIHVLVRQRFRDALVGFDGVHVHALPTADILAPVYKASTLGKAPKQLFDSDLEALNNLDMFLEPLRAKAFDRIINLTFSPFSSFLTDDLTHPHTLVSGYTRQSDGYLAIPDDSSAYFYAQSGIGRASRYHVTDIFAAVSSVELVEEDFSFSSFSHETRDQIVIHLGASQAEKAYPAEMWREVIRQLLDGYSGDIVVIGSKDEANMANSVCEGFTAKNLHNRVGHSTLKDVFVWLKESRLLIGADSAPLHIAALTSTPVLNLSSSTVNFWETGPRSAGSRVLYEPSLSAIPVDRVVREAQLMLSGSPPQGPCAFRQTVLGSFEYHEMTDERFTWDLIQALYTGSDYPELENRSALGFQRLFELAELALEHLAQWNERRQTAIKVLANIDDLLLEIPRLDPLTAPVVGWFQTERLRIPPGTPEDTFAKTQKLFSDLLWISAVYRKFRAAPQEIQNSIDLCRRCAPHFRDFDFGHIQNDFQTLLSTFHELARHSTMVGEKSWASVLLEIDLALERRDFIELADQLEHVLIPALSNQLKLGETSA